jgi:hypothetical protein
MRCTICNSEMITNHYYDWERTIHNCPSACHVIVDHLNGKKDETFSFPFITKDNVCVPFDARNVSEFVMNNGIKTRVKYSALYYQGWERFRFDDFILQPGTKILPYTFTYMSMFRI